MTRANPILATRARKVHLESFDTLRAFAILLVMVFHGSYGIFRGGFIGVDLFFVLSGYLITSLLHREYLSSADISLSKFYARRALRLFPPLIICVVLSNILWASTEFDPGTDRIVSTLSALFYFTNLLDVKVLGNMVHLWSLSVEEHFYLIWPITVLFFLFKMSVRRCITFLIVLILVIAVFRVITFYNADRLVYGIFRINPYGFTLCRIDGILLGALLYFIMSDPKINHQIGESKPGDLVVGVILFSSFILFGFTIAISSSYWLSGGFVLTNILCTLTVLIAVRNPNHKLLSSKILGWIGKRSYGIYAYHFPIFMASEGLRVHHSIRNFLGVSLLRFALTIGLAAFSYDFIEQPILKLKQRFEVKATTNN